MSRVHRLVFALVPALALFGGAEAVVRLVTEPDAGRFAEELRPLDLRVPGPAEVRRDGPYTWRTHMNPDGIREAARVPVAPEPDELRILATGDSWVFGYGVDIGRTLPDALEEVLGARLGRKVQVINGGAPGASAKNMVQRTLGLLQQYEGVSGVLLGQPHNPRGGARKAAEPPVGEAVFARFRLLRLARFQARLARADHPPRTNDDAALTQEVADLKRLAGQLRGRKLDVWLVRFPQDRVTAMHGEYGPEREWRLGVPMGGHALRERACWGWEDPFHPSEAGVRAIAEAMVPVILEKRTFERWSEEPRCADVPGAGPGKGEPVAG